MNLYEQSIHHLHELRTKKEISTQDIAASVLSRIEDTEAEVESFLYLSDKEEVLQKAKDVDEKIAKGEAISPLAGMPIAVKDIFSTKGIPTTCASKYLENYIPPYESTATEKLIAADYNMIGKVNMDEFAMGSSTENSAFKQTKNPWDLSRVPGGSSGGSAACVAAGQALAALGTDTGGSIRQPASFNNIVGLKPTYGRISRWGMVAFASSLDQAGPMTRDVQDAALLLEAMSGYDDKDATSLNLPNLDLQSSLNQDVKGMKVGVIKELDLASCDADVLKTYEENLEILKKGGAEIVEVSMPNLEHAVATYYVIAPSEASSNLGRYDGVRYGHRSNEAGNLEELYSLSREEGLGKEVKMRILLGTFALSAGYYDAYYLKAQKIQNLIRAQYKQAFSAVDVIATPVAPTPAFKLGEHSDNPLHMYLADAFTIPANLAGIPGISVPGGFSAGGLPIGLQLLGGHLQEQTLVKVAHYFEQNNPIQAPKLAI